MKSYSGLSESFEVDGLVVKVSGQSRGGGRGWFIPINSCNYFL